jgi:membrane protease YdiL (CAAX protease family)
MSIGEGSTDPEAGSKEALRRPSQIQRGAEVTMLVALWMALGTALHLSVEEYLLLGVPLTALFQIAIRRQPLRALWVRDAPPFRLRRFGWVVAVMLAALPALDALVSLSDREWHSAAFNAVIAVGAFPAAYCLWNLTRSRLRQLAACLLISCALDVVFRATLWMLHLESAPHTLNGKTLQTLALEIPIFLPTMCVMEEVSFRGLLDSHLHHAEDGRGWLSAAYLSALWGIWHLPILDMRGQSWPAVVLLMLAAHVPFGITMSLFWRRSGNLLVPGAAHTMLDAVRDAFFL